MNFQQVLDELKKAGSEQTRKTYARHGVTGKAFGVSYAVLGKLTRKLKQNQEVAEKLWRSGVHDARILATMVADVAQLKVSELEAWIKEADNYVMCGAVATLVAQGPHASKLAHKWIKAKDEWRSAAGWSVFARIAADTEQLSDVEARALIQKIEKDIHRAPNRTRYEMNGALIAIGIARQNLRAEAVAAARRIGKVDVDHGDTGCKTPDAVPYIEKAVARHKAKASTSLRAKKKASSRKVASKKVTKRKSTPRKTAARKAAKKKAARKATPRKKTR